MNIMNEVTFLPNKTVNRPGAIDDLFGIVSEFGTKGLIVHAPSFARSGCLGKLQSAQPKGMNVRYNQYPGGEPTVAMLEELIAFAQQENTPDWVFAIGGGSVLDITKA